jgi:uncharacterized protein (DUF342 family)
MDEATQKLLDSFAQLHTDIQRSRRKCPKEKAAEQLLKWEAKMQKHDAHQKKQREEAITRDHQKKVTREKRQQSTNSKPNYKTCIKVMRSLGYTPLHSGTTSSVFYIDNRYIHIRRAPNKGLFWFSTDSEKPMYTRMVEAQGHRFSQLNRYLTDLQA